MNIHGKFTKIIALAFKEIYSNEIYIYFHDSSEFWDYQDSQAWFHTFWHATRSLLSNFHLCTWLSSFKYLCLNWATFSHTRKTTQASSLFKVPVSAYFQVSVCGCAWCQKIEWYIDSTIILYVWWNNSFTLCHCLSANWLLLLSNWYFGWLDPLLRQSLPDWEKNGKIQGILANLEL